MPQLKRYRNRCDNSIRLCLRPMECPLTLELGGLLRRTRELKDPGVWLLIAILGNAEHLCESLRGDSHLIRYSCKGSAGVPSLEAGTFDRGVSPHRREWRRSGLAFGLGTSDRAKD